MFETIFSFRFTFFTPLFLYVNLFCLLYTQNAFRNVIKHNGAITIKFALKTPWPVVSEVTSTVRWR